MAKRDSQKTSGTALPAKGEIVSWQTSQGRTEGVVEKIATGPTKVKGYTAKASPQHPEIVVRSRKSGRRAVHKPSSLKPV